MLQVTTPVAPKNYNLTTKPIVQTDEIFDLVDLSKVVKTSERADENAQQDASFDKNSGVIPKLPMLIAKDPSLTASSLKSMLSNEILNQLSESGNAELINKLTDLAKEILLSPDQLVTDIKSQQQSSTIFNGDFFNLLRGIAAQTSNSDIKNAILNILKATVNASSGQEVLNSLSLNMKYLSEQLAPSKSLSDALLRLSDKLSSPNASKDFQALKGQVLGALQSVNNSLLLTDKTKNLLPLITHNLSRFNDNSTALKESFTNLLDLLSNKDLKAALSKSFNDFVEVSDLPQSVKSSALSAVPDNGVSDKVASETLLKKLTSDLASLANSNSKILDAVSLKDALSNIPADNGMNSIKDMLMQVLPKSSEKMLNNLLGDFSQTKDLNSLLGKLSTILNSIDSMDVKLPLAQSLNEALTHLAKAENIHYSPPSSMENLVTFLSKNINDTALKSLNTFNQNEMVQSLLTAPGVFTPLLHYLVPVQVEDTRAFGELWVDNDAGGSSNSDDTNNHFFLSFTVENIGDFELEIYTKNTDISILLMCPPDLTKSFSKMKDSIAKIAAANGFSAKNTTVEPLKSKRNLVDVFSRIKEKRVGLNVTI